MGFHGRQSGNSVCNSATSSDVESMPPLHRTSSLQRCACARSINSLARPSITAPRGVQKLGSLSGMGSRTVNRKLQSLFSKPVRSIIGVRKKAESPIKKSSWMVSGSSVDGGWEIDAEER